jgi:hypothetical protein
VIEWQLYNPLFKPKLTKNYLVTNGLWVRSALLTGLFDGRDWYDESGYLERVTHFAEINLPRPREFEPGDFIKYVTADDDVLHGIIRRVSNGRIYFEGSGSARKNRVQLSDRAAVMKASQACQDGECVRFRNINGGCDKCNSPCY